MRESKHYFTKVILAITTGVSVQKSGIRVCDRVKYTCLFCGATDMWCVLVRRDWEMPEYYRGEESGMEKARKYSF